MAIPGGIDQQVNQKVDAYRNNPQALQQRYQQNQELLDLLALQKIKSEKEAAKSELAMQQQQQPSTILQQREQELTKMTKDEMTQQMGGIMAQRNASQQKNLQRAAQGQPAPALGQPALGQPAPAQGQPAGMAPAQNIMGNTTPKFSRGGIVTRPAPNMARFAQGGIVGYKGGGKTEGLSAERRAELLKLVGLTQEQYNARSPEQRAAIRDTINSKLGVNRGGAALMRPGATLHDASYGTARGAIQAGAWLGNLLDLRDADDPLPFEGDSWTPAHDSLSRQRAESRFVRPGDLYADVPPDLRPKPPTGVDPVAEARNQPIDMSTLPFEGEQEAPIPVPSEGEQEAPIPVDIGTGVAPSQSSSQSSSQSPYAVVDDIPEAEAVQATMPESTGVRSTAAYGLDPIEKAALDKERTEAKARAKAAADISSEAAFDNRVSKVGKIRDREGIAAAREKQLADSKAFYAAQQADRDKYRSRDRMSAAGGWGGLANIGRAGTRMRAEDRKLAERGFLKGQGIADLAIADDMGISLSQVESGTSAEAAATEAKSEGMKILADLFTSGRETLTKDAENVLGANIANMEAEDRALRRGLDLALSNADNYTRVQLANLSAAVQVAVLKVEDTKDVRKTIARYDGIYIEAAAAIDAEITDRLVAAAMVADPKKRAEQEALINKMGEDSKKVLMEYIEQKKNILLRGDNTTVRQISP